MPVFLFAGSLNLSAIVEAQTDIYFFIPLWPSVYYFLFQFWLKLIDLP